jgi:hypothetical protein
VYTSLRRYRVQGSAAAFARRVELGVVPLVAQAPGFRSYAGVGLLVTIAALADLAGAEGAERQWQDSERGLAVSESLWSGGDQTSRVRMPDGLSALGLPHDRAPAPVNCAGLPNVSMEKSCGDPTRQQAKAT